MLSEQHDYVVGKLKRQQGTLKQWKHFIYVKKGIFLEEFSLKSHYDVDEPRRMYDISGSQVTTPQNARNPSVTFSVLTRGKEEIVFIADSVEEKKKWVDSLTTTVESTHFMSCAALIAPVRRRQSSFSYTMKKKNVRSISIIQIDEKGIIKEVDRAVSLMFGYKEEDLVGQKMRMLFSEESKSRFTDHLSNYVKEKSGQGKPSAVRNLNCLRKNKEEFSVSLSFDKQSSIIRVKILDRSPALPQEPVEKDDYKTIATLRVDIMEARDLGKVKKLLNPYCVILLDGVEKTTTTTKPKSVSPFWGQEYVFDDIKSSNKTVTIMINSQNKSSRDPRLGFVDVNISELNPTGRPLDKWFSIEPINIKGPSSPSIRMKFALTVEKIMPYREYKEIIDLFLDDKLICATALARATTSQLDEVAGTLVNIFAMKNRVTDFVRKLTAVEVQKTDRGSILFRGNSLGTKVIDLYMKMVGFDYLQETLTPLIEAVYADKESCEIDPTRLEKGEDIKKNQKRLIAFTKKFFDCISNSIDHCPNEMKMIFASVRSEVARKFSETEEHTSVAGFVFLRFFCPAILNPKMFGIVDEHPTGVAGRTLTLIAKAIQNLANLVPQAKEKFMEFMVEFLEQHLNAMRTCVARFATLDEEAAFEFSGVVNKRDLSREMSALYRHCQEAKEELINITLEEPDPKLNELFRVLDILEKRQSEYERKNLDFLKNNPNLPRPSISLTGIQE